MIPNYTKIKTKETENTLTNGFNTKFDDQSNIETRKCLHAKYLALK
jgi:hypothetical protein